MVRRRAFAASPHATFRREPSRTMKVRLWPHPSRRIAFRDAPQDEGIERAMTLWDQDDEFDEARDQPHRLYAVAAGPADPCPRHDRAVRLRRARRGPYRDASWAFRDRGPPRRALPADSCRGR